MRIVFAGTPQPAVASLQALHDSPHDVVAVLTRPDAPAGRGRTLQPSPVRVRAEQLGVPVLTPRSAKDPELARELTGLAPDVCAVVAYGALIPPSLLDVPAHGWINLHFSLLPAWRGAAPVQHAIIHGDEVTGATTFVLEPGLDTGPVLGTMTERIRPNDTSGDLLHRLSDAGAGLLVATMDGLADESLTAVAQSAEGISSAPKLTVAEGQIRWHEPAFAVDRRIRGCTPAPGAWSTLRGERVKIGPVNGIDNDIELAPGALLVTKRQVLVGTAQGAVILGTMQGHGKKAMPAADWARGTRIDEGEVLGG